MNQIASAAAVGDFADADRPRANISLKWQIGAVRLKERKRNGEGNIFTIVRAQIHSCQVRLTFFELGRVLFFGSSHVRFELNHSLKRKYSKIWHLLRPEIW